MTSKGPPVTGITPICVLPATFTMLTFWLDWFVTYATAPVDEKATSVGMLPTRTSAPTVCDCRSTRLSLPRSTCVVYAMPLGAIAAPYARFGTLTRTRLESCTVT